MSKLREQRKRIEAGPLNAAFLDEIAERLLSVQEMLKEGRPEGVVEPLHPITVTSTPQTVRTPTEKLWFSVTITKEAAVEVHVIVNSGKSSTTPYTMGVDEKVYDQYFSRPCIYDVTLWTDGPSCEVKIRGSR